MSEMNDPSPSSPTGSDWPQRLPRRASRMMVPRALADDPGPVTVDATWVGARSNPTSWPPACARSQSSSSSPTGGRGWHSLTAVAPSSSLRRRSWGRPAFRTASFLSASANSIHPARRSFSVTGRSVLPPRLRSARCWTPDIPRKRSSTTAAAFMIGSPSVCPRSEATA